MAVLADEVERHRPVAPAAAPALVAVVLVAAVAAVAGGSVPLAAASVPVAMLPAAVVDLRSFRLPNRLVAGGALAGGLIAASERSLTTRLDEASLASIALGVLLFAGPLLVVHLLAPAAMGFGDVKLAVALGAAIGLTEPVAALTALLIACAIATSGGLIGRRATVPFGPALVAGTAIALATNSWVAS